MLAGYYTSMKYKQTVLWDHCSGLLAHQSPQSSGTIIQYLIFQKWKRLEITFQRLKALKLSMGEFSIRAVLFVGLTGDL